MPEMTPHTGLKKPLESETADITVINENMDKIDSALGDLAGVPTTAKDAAGAITELFTNVSDGKAVIASAITDKGVPTDAEDTFAEMAGNIEAIPVGPDTSDATASASDLRTGKTAYVDGVKIAGAVSTKGAVNPGHEPAIGYDVSGSNLYLKAPKGIYDQDTWIVQTEPDLVSANIKAGVNILGVVGKTQVMDTTTPSGATAAQVLAGREAFVNGVKVVGTVANRNVNVAATGSDGLTAGRLNLRPPAGLWDGNAWVYLDDPDFIAANIRSGVNLFGLTGSLVEGRPFASGATMAGTTVVSFVRYPSGFLAVYPVTVAGLSFTPRVVLLYQAGPISGVYPVSFFYSDAPVTSTGKPGGGLFTDSAAGYRMSLEPPASMVSGGFTLPGVMDRSTSVYWYAFG